MPEWADARYSLGSVYARIDRVPEAIAELRAALALDPRHFRANLLLGRILTLRGEAAAAIPYLKAAVDVQSVLDRGEAVSGRGAQEIRLSARRSTCRACAPS